MKKILVVSAILVLLGAGTMASAVGPGWGPGACNGPGNGAGYGPGTCDGAGGCGGPGYGRGMMGYGGGPAFEGNEEFLNETADLRKQLHDKRFEYFEKARNSETDEESLVQLEEEIDALRDQIREKAPRRGYGRGWRR